MNNKEIKISTLLKIFRKYFVYILVVTLIFGALGGVYAGVMQETTYTATAEFYIPNFQASSDYVSDNLLTASESLAEICADLVKRNDIVSIFADDLSADKYFGTDKVTAIRELTKTISSKTQGKGYLSVSATSVDRDFAFSVIQSIQKYFPEQVAKTVAAKGETSRYETTLVPVKTITEKDQITVNNPSMAKSALIFAFIACVATYCVFLIKYLMDTMIHDIQDIEENFEEPILAVIPEYYTAEEKKQLRRFGQRRIKATDVSKSKRQYKDKLLTKKTPFAVVESFNTLRTNICYSTAAEKCPVFVITSDFSAAGKSFVSANASISLAALGKKTLLVECDMRCPDFNRIFGTDVRDGLSEVLSGNIKDNSEVIIKTGYENFDIVFSGHVPPNPSELIGSHTMVSLLDEWKENYDCIILDMPPLVEVSDASIVASLVSGYIIVARPNHSDIVALTGVTRDIKGVEGNIIGYVVNGVDLKSGGSDVKYDRYSKYSKYNRYGKYAKYSRYAKYAKYAKYSKYRVYADIYHEANGIDKEETKEETNV